MNEEVILKKLLSPLKRVAPDSAYMSRSKQMIMLSRQEAAVAPLFIRLRSRIFEGATFSVGLALASILLVIVLGGFSAGGHDGQSTTVATSLSNDSLAMEAEMADFNLQIQEISYFDESAKQVAMALDKISGEHDQAQPEKP